MSGSFIFLLVCLSSFDIECTASFRGRKSTKRVRDGAVDIINWPHVVYLAIGKKTCGSSLITPNIVLTSAYCAREISLSKTKASAYFGATAPYHPRNSRTIIACKIHPEYHDSKGQFDLGIAKLDSAIPMNRGISIIPVGVKRLKLNESVYVAGWSITQTKGRRHRFVRPMVSEQKLVPISVCTNTPAIKKSSPTYCAVPVEENYYKGNWGDGLVTIKSSKVLVGVVSNITKGAILYTNLKYHKKWLKQAIHGPWRRIARS